MFCIFRLKNVGHFWLVLLKQPRQSCSVFLETSTLPNFVMFNCSTLVLNDLNCLTYEKLQVSHVAQGNN